MNTLGSREGIWDALKNPATGYDIIIIGGGITGAGILREATRHGLKALLIEQRDFAWGTSSRSSKMVHGGLRYIAQGALGLTRRSALERERLIREAPGLVDRMGSLLPVRSGQSPGKFALNAVLALYDRLAGIKTHGWRDPDAVLQRAPGLNTQGLLGASYYTDAVTDDARLVLRLLQQACSEGGQVINYVAAESLLRNQSGQVNGLMARNIVNDETLPLQASVVINATGAWVDNLRETLGQPRTIRPLRGSHIVLPARLIPLQDALTLFHPQDRRAVFIFPWEGCTVVGTTDLDHSPSLQEEPGITTHEVQYLLQLVQQQFPAANISPADIVSTYAGVRPVISNNRNKDPSKEKRDHQVWVDQGLVSVSGGKLTTFRLIARDTLAAAKPLLRDARFDNRDQCIFPPTSLTPAALGLQDTPWALRLIGRYGEAAKSLLADTPAAEQQKIEGTEFCLAELRWSCRNEQIVHLDDLLLRRSRIGLLISAGGSGIFSGVRIICQQELGWDDSRWLDELQRYQTLWQQHYSLPGT